MEQQVYGVQQTRFFDATGNHGKVQHLLGIKQDSILLTPEEFIAAYRDAEKRSPAAQRSPKRFRDREKGRLYVTHMPVASLKGTIGEVIWKTPGRLLDVAAAGILHTIDATFEGFEDDEHVSELLNLLETGFNHDTTATGEALRQKAQQLGNLYGKALAQLDRTFTSYVVAETDDAHFISYRGRNLTERPDGMNSEIHGILLGSREQTLSLIKELQAHPNKANKVFAHHFRPDKSDKATYNTEFDACAEDALVKNARFTDGTYKALQPKKISLYMD